MKTNGLMMLLYITFIIGVIKMPAIYSFSLDHKYDKDIINRLEGMKNRSSWIRQMLRRELDYERLQGLVEILHKAYAEQVKMASMFGEIEFRIRSLHEFKEVATRTWSTRIDQQEIPPVRQEDHNSLQEQE